jgi:antitoxin (DNA-binding transcriptional repressor) of toxin-antitoxin stability system
MAATVDVQKIAERWDELLATAAAGKAVIVTENDIPKARIVPLTRNRILGLHPNALEISEDFNDPLPDSFWCESN